MGKIQNIIGREILDSRGNPTVEVKIILDNGQSAKASVPSGASTGSYEAVELRDQEQNRYGGLGTLKAVENINRLISPALKGRRAEEPEKIDLLLQELDGTENKRKLGANATLAVSLACVRAGALAEEKGLYEYLALSYGFPSDHYRLPIPCFNIFNGGRHADTNLDFQEFLIIPRPGEGTGRGKNVSGPRAEMVRLGAEIFHNLAAVLKEAGYDTDVGSEGGYAPDIVSSVQALELISAAILRAGYQPGEDVGLGIDVGASQLFRQNERRYIFRLDQASFTTDNLVGLYYEWFRKFPIIYLEDGLDEEDWSGWRELTRELGGEIMIVGDDLFATNINRLRQGLKEKAANSIIIKPNQIGTLSEAIACLKLAKKHNYKIIVSHRSGETCDDFIVDLAVAAGADYLKAGSLSRGERVAKYNRLMEIEAELGY